MAEQEEPQDEPEITSDDRLQQIAEARALVGSKAEELEKAQAKLEGAKSVVKVKQQAYDAAVADLLDVIDNKQQEFQFGKPGEEAEDSGAWRQFPMDFDIIPHNHILEKLADAGVKTLGDLTDKIAAEPGLHQGAETIPGIGPAAAEKIERVLDSFWEDHPQFCNEEPAADPDEDGNQGEAE